jgi:hypothetical protein
MSRFALFTVALFVIVAIGSQSRHGGSSLKSMCVCVPTRAKLIMKSAIVKTQARSAELFNRCPVTDRFHTPRAGRLGQGTSPTPG